MNLQLYKFTCYCGCVFEFPNLIDQPYGEFLLKSETDELIYLNSFEAKEFDELASLLKSKLRWENTPNSEQVEIFHSLLSLICDLSPQKKIYFIQKYPNCLQCKSPYQMKNWVDIYPPEIVDIVVKQITFNEWNCFNESEKKELIYKGIEYAKKKTEEYREYIRKSPWIGISTKEKEEIMSRGEKLNTKNFKEMLRAFRILRGLDPGSPIG